MQIKSVIMDDKTMMRALMRMSHEIIERYRGVENVVLVGIRRRGVPLAAAIANVIEQVEGVKVPVGELDITHYRDDLSTIGELPALNSTNIPFSVTGQRVVLVDDVIYTGRTCRAAIEALFSMGRPAAISLAVMVDRGHRELPLRPDYVGRNIPTSRDEIVSVRLPEYDGVCDVVLSKKD